MQQKEKVIPPTTCQCDVMVMCPERVSFDAYFTHVCKTCGGGITFAMNDDYNRYGGFSGYDE
ncbi:churchill protein [Caudoviricetes sp.]|nr:churchill protein [Caudoviricetes sp.]